MKYKYIKLICSIISFNLFYLSTFSQENINQKQNKKIDAIIEKDLIHICFWRWPWGHCYHYLNDYNNKCCQCPKEKSSRHSGHMG